MTILPLRLRAAARRLLFGSLPLAGLLAGFGLPVAALATVDLRIEARPISDPVQAFVTVTDASGNPVLGLSPNDFSVTIDGNAVLIGSVTPPSEQEASQRVSVVFALDYSTSVTDVARDAMEQAAITFVTGMQDGDQAAIIKFNDTNPARASVVIPFTTIDHGANNDLLEAAAISDYPGDGTNLLDALELAVNQFVAPLPAGPKAVILVSDGGENESSISESEVVALANANSIPIFTIGVGDLTLPGREELMSGLGSETGGQYYETASDQEIANAYAAISILLTQEYLISIPSGIMDCAEHTLVVNVAGPAPGTATATFTRRTCDTEPDPFSFTSQTGVGRTEDITSNTVTITGIEVPAHVSVITGSYSIGCNGTFTGAPGTIVNGQTVCVRHHSPNAFSTAKTTTLTIGGFAATFTSTTQADGGGGSGGGGGTGLLELLLGLGALLLARRRFA